MEQYLYAAQITSAGLNNNAARWREGGVKNACCFDWSSEGGTSESETLVPFATSAEAVATVESRTSGGTMDSETLVPIAASTYSVAMVECGTSLTWGLGRSTIESRVVLYAGGTMSSEIFVPVYVAAATCV